MNDINNTTNTNSVNIDNLPEGTVVELRLTNIRAENMEDWRGGILSAKVCKGTNLNLFMFDDQTEGWSDYMGYGDLEKDGVARFPRGSFFEAGRWELEAHVYYEGRRVFSNE